MRRVAVVLALLCSGTAISAAPNVVHAAEPAAAVENIYRTQVIQTTGPASSALPWGLDRIDQRDLPLSGSYSYTATGAGVKAYIVDSGIKSDHVEFAGRVASGWSYRSASQSTLNTWRTSLGSCKDNPDYDPTDHPVDVDEFDYTSTPSDVGSPDNHGHGTHVAGTVGGTNTGVAKGVTLVPVRVLNSCGEGISSMLLAGLDWILADHQLGEPAVVNMSIGFTSRDYDIDAKIAELMAEGIVVVAAAGNKGTSACSTTPAATPGTISVGASTSSDAEASWSNYGQCVDMYAPGVSVTSAWNYEGSTANPYSTISGTSMAAPHVAGVVARYLQGVVTTSTTETETWLWLDENMTTGKIARSHLSPPAGESFTPNKLLAIVVPDAVTGLTLTASSRQISASWTLVAGLTYIVTASPGGGTCTTTTSGCVISGLTNNQEYSIAVTATNGFGNSRASTSVATPVGPPVPVTGLAVVPQAQSLVMSWARGEGDDDGITYTATATPGGLTCSTTTTTCTISGLTNGTEYSVSVVGANAAGTSTAVSVTGTPVGLPEAPASALSISRNKSISLSWGAVVSTANVTYVVSKDSGDVVCRTTETSCVVDGLRNGVNYSFTITTNSATGLVAATSLGLSARPGFTIKKTEVAKKSRTLLSRLLTSVSTGKKTWKKAGSCSIVRGRLVAPNRKSNCSLSLSVAKTRKYPAMRTRVTIRVK
jgi:subtilisin family serine protease